MDKNWEMKTRESFRRASLEDSLVDFIGSVDESEEFEGYGARFNAKCVESVTKALKEHSRALQQHQDSVDRVYGAIGNIQKLLLVLAICSVFIAIGSFWPGSKNNSTSMANGQGQPQKQINENNGQNLISSPPPIQNAHAKEVKPLSSDQNNSPSSQGRTVSPSQNQGGIQNDELLKPSRIDLINRIKERSKIPTSEKQSLLNTPPVSSENEAGIQTSLDGGGTKSFKAGGENRTGSGFSYSGDYKPNYGGGTSIPGESAWDTWKE